MQRKTTIAALTMLGMFVAACGYAGGGSAQVGYLASDRESPPSVERQNDSAQPPKADTGEPFDMFHKQYGTNPFVDTEDMRQSTFAVDVDTGSYTVCRDYLNRGYMPPDEAPRVEEFVNYFKYKYEAPRDGVFNIAMDVAPSRYGQDIKHCHLLRVGVQAKTIDPAERKPAVLTFVVDVSGSMDMENRLGLVKKALRMLVKQLRKDDYVGIAVYGSTGRKVLSHTNDPERIIDALESLKAEGATYAEEGIRMGYEMAAAAYRDKAINRVILCSDGVANVGQTGPDAILKTVVEYRRKGITLSSIGFGMSNYNDTLLEQLGDKGDGHYAYVDTLDEAKRIFVDNLTGTLQVVARDTKVQLEFNPEVVKSWRLLGYENRWLKNEDFRNDSVDGGEVGAGHSVTALYEIKLVEGATGDIAKATVRYKHDELNEFVEVTRGATTRDIKAWADAPVNLRVAANVAEFAELLRKSYWAKGGSYNALLEDVKKLIAETDDSDVLELANLITKAIKLEQAKDTGVAGGK
ncbi:MAG: von Willebrand factor type A domain-containing protein [Planctomycetes bacterium]|nr:von Willebrand factor type A domain-containing protein [Planctomycetota bacterium]MCW8136381.1 von Willebrand factor type A domain-containing protein [Planctomycetota bacterium]